ncbi:MAG: FG-GAP repeat protein [Myxococcales bacterium]|nr:FG-GAP repeat protein [Myxococcales bacterium]
MRRIESAWALAIGAICVGCGPAKDSSASATDSGTSTDTNATETETGGLGAPGFVIDGAGPDDYAGALPCGDVNGDGLGDLVVRRRGTPGYVVFGRAEEGVLRVGEIEPGIDGAAVDGASFDDGYSSRAIVLAAAGDVNGDGFDDLVVSRERSEDLAEVAVVFGGPVLASVDLDALAPEQGRALLEVPLGWAGSVHTYQLGDVNGDGFDDLAIVVGDGSEGGVDSIYVVFGGDALALTSVEALTAGDGGFAITGVYSPETIAAGDMNGDGLRDLVILEGGGPHESHSEIYVVFGGDALGTLDLTDSYGEGDVIVPPDFGGYTVLLSDATYAFLPAGGQLVAGHDVNGDGLDDLVVGGPLPAGSGWNLVHVIYGRSQVGSVRVPEELGDGVGLSITAESLPGGWDTYVIPSLSGDLNGDLRGEITLAVNVGGPGPNEHVETYVIYGDVEATAVDIGAVAQGEGGYILSAWPEVQHLGEAAEWADIDGVGGLELIIRDPESPANGENSGRTYVYFDPGVH